MGGRRREREGGLRAKEEREGRRGTKASGDFNVQF